MHKFIVIFAFLSFCFNHLSGQQKDRTNIDYSANPFLESIRGNREFRMTAGTCNEVLATLRASYENDSQAVDIFKKEYEITNMPGYFKRQLFAEAYPEIIRFFNEEQNHTFYCRSKRFHLNEPILLMDRREGK